MSLIKLETLYGTLELDDPLLIELIQSAPMQRLKGIHQYGVVNAIFPSENYSRFDHSLGVCWLLQKAKTSREELIAGLLHDASHTVFSHVGDFVFKIPCMQQSYQDQIHLWYLQESGIQTILKKYQVQLEDKLSTFLALDQPLPHLCADRIEYNLQGAFLQGLLSKGEFQEILSSLHFEKGAWVFDFIEPALQLGRISLTMTETLWGAPWEVLLYRWTADALQRAFEINLITSHEFHFSQDNQIWHKLVASSDPTIADLISQMQRVKNSFKLADLGQEDLLLPVKFRGVDPRVKTAKGVQPLTELSPTYAKEFSHLSAKMAQGWPIQLLGLQR